MLCLAVTHVIFLHILLDFTRANKENVLQKTHGCSHNKLHEDKEQLNSNGSDHIKRSIGMRNYFDINYNYFILFNNFNNTITPLKDNQTSFVTHVYL